MAKNSLLEQVFSTPRYRQNGLFPDTSNVVIFCHKDNAVLACEEIHNHSKNINIAGVCAHKGTSKTITVNLSGKIVEVPVLKPEMIKELPQCTAVLYWNKSIVPDLLYHLETAVPLTRDIAIFPRIPEGTGRKINADLYKRAGKELEQIYSSLADDESRLSFASVVKGLLKGEIEWLKPPVCSEYQHPFVHAEPGDIVIDAGLFDSTVLRKFALAVGSSGYVYGFEPEPNNFEFVQETLKKFGDPGNITLVKKGLYSSRDEMVISDEGPSGFLTDNIDITGHLCQTVDIDSFVDEYKLPRIDLIKMDIEGAELQALEGAKKSIQKWKPKLQICAYHHIDDIIDIYSWIKKTVPEYKFYFTAHTPYLNEYVYYAIV